MYYTTYINVYTLTFFPGKWMSCYSAVRKPWESICIASKKLKYGFGEPGTRQGEGEQHSTAKGIQIQLIYAWHTVSVA